MSRPIFNIGEMGYKFRMKIHMLSSSFINRHFLSPRVVKALVIGGWSLVAMVASENVSEKISFECLNTNCAYRNRTDFSLPFS